MVNHLKNPSIFIVSGILGALSIATSLPGLVGSSSAEAATLTSVSGRWSNPQGGNSIRYVEADGASQIFWGVPFNPELGQSGLSFSGNQDVDVEIGTAFQVGQLTHFNRSVINQPIPSETAVSAVTLTIDLLFGDIVQSAAFDFIFDIEETPNGNPLTCAYPGLPACPDRLTWTPSVISDAIMIDGKAYIFELLGFQNPATGAYENSFISQEGGSSEALLYGHLVLAPGQSVPEPGLLIGLGAVALCGVYRRRR